MAKKQAAKEQDKFVVRLPAGMRDRIKVKADRAGMSMNEAIVWCLEKEFPGEVTIAQRIEELADLVAMLKDSNNPSEGIEDLISAVDTTLTQISDDKITMDRNFAEMVASRLMWWEEVELANRRDKLENPFDHIEWDSKLPKIGKPDLGHSRGKDIDD